jgi:hypothetical protein
MSVADDLVRAMPIVDVHVRAGVYSNCGGVARVLADFAAAPAFELVSAIPDATDDPAHDQELIDLCVTNAGIGVEAELRELFGGEPPAVRVVLRAVHANWVDSNESVNERCGRYVVREAVRRAGLDTALAVSRPAPSERVIPPRPS